MAWKHNGRTIQTGKGWIDDSNIRHPRNWVIWTATYKEATGLVWEDDPTPLGSFDNFYYYGWNSDGDALLPRPLAGLKLAKVKEAKQPSSQSFITNRLVCNS